jgi:hypothetical protein
MGGVSGILDRGDPPATPPEEKIKIFRSVTKGTAAIYKLLQI